MKHIRLEPQREREGEGGQRGGRRVRRETRERGEMRERREREGEVHVVWGEGGPSAFYVPWDKFG